MKKILALLVIVLLCGCGIKEKEKTVDCILKPYAELISEENRQNLVIYYDSDGVFDRYTISSLVSTSLFSSSKLLTASTVSSAIGVAGGSAIDIIQLDNAL